MQTLPLPSEKGVQSAMNDMNDSNELERDETLSAEIDRLLKEGYSQRQLRKLGYSPSLIRQRIRKKVKREGMPPPEGAGGKAPISLTVKEKETVLPEWLEQQVGEIFDGSIQSQKAFLAGMSIPLLGMRLFSQSMRPFGDLMRLWQAGQADAARAAQESGANIARETVNLILPPVLGTVKEAAIAASPNPLAGMAQRLIEPFFQNMFGGMLSRMTAGNIPQTQQGQQSQTGISLPPGWSLGGGQE